MNYFLFYFFSILAISSAFYAAFSNHAYKGYVSIILFLLSFTGLLTLINGGYLSFVIFILTAGIFAYILIINPYEDSNAAYKSTNILQLISISLAAALTASLAGSTIWQGNVLVKKDITQASLGETISGEYYLIFLSFLTSAFILKIIASPKPK
ncbi:MAG TPA: hypothetical protein VGK25_14090 [Ignavibacteria bacterium]|jgi:hypothetical protein